MRKICLLLLFMFVPLVAYSADTKVSDLVEDTAPLNENLLYCVDNPTGTELSRKCTIGNVFSAATDLDTNGVISANSVALTTDTTGNYIATITGGTGVDSDGATSGEGITHTLSLDLTEATCGTGLTCPAATTVNCDDADDDGSTQGCASFDNTDFNATSGNVTIVDDGHAHTTTSLSNIDISDDTNLAVSGTLLDLTDDTLSVNEGTLTDNNLCDYEATGTQIECTTNSSSELADIINDETGTGVMVFGTSPTFTTGQVTTGVFEAVASGVSVINHNLTVSGAISGATIGGITESNLVDKSTIEAITGSWDFGGASELEIPNSATPTVNATGEIAVDSNGMAATHGSLEFYDGTQTLHGVGTTDTPSDNEVPKFDSGTGKITWEADAGAGGGDPDQNLWETMSAGVFGSTTANSITDTFTFAGASNITVTISGDTLTIGNTATAGAQNFHWDLQPQQAKLPTNNPMGIDAGNNRWRGLFDDTTPEAASWATVLRPYQGGTLQAKVGYSLVTTSSSDVVGVQISIMCVSDDDAQDIDSDSYGSPDILTSGSVSTTAGRLNVIADASLSGDSCAEDDYIIVAVQRDAIGIDTTAGDVELRWVVIYE